MFESQAHPNLEINGKRYEEQGKILRPFETPKRENVTNFPRQPESQPQLPDNVIQFPQQEIPTGNTTSVEDTSANAPANSSEGAPPQPQNKNETPVKMLWRLDPKAENYDPQQAVKLAEDHLKNGGSISELTDIAKLHPEVQKLVNQKAVEQVQAALPLIENGADIQDISKNEKGELEVKTKEGRTVTLTEVGVVMGALMLDMVFGNGRNTMYIFESMINEAARDGFRDYLKNIGFTEDDLGEESMKKMYDKILNTVNTETLYQIFEKFDREKSEMYNFLKDLDKDEVRKMLTGQEFGAGGVFAAKHKFSSDQIQIVWERLTDLDAKKLGVFELKQQAVGKAA